MVSYRYDLPFFSGTQGYKRALLAGWAISGITIFQSGSPFSVTDSGAGTAFLGPGLASATLGGQLADGGSIGAGTTSGDIHSRLNGYLNPINFVPASLLSAADGGDGTVTIFGNLGRNIYRGPFQQNWDFSLIKNFSITERQSLRFTTDCFNIWNHANFANPGNLRLAQGIPGAPGSGLQPGQPFSAATAGANFGVLNQTVSNQIGLGTNRQIQLSMRLLF